mmetsp:Transcript_19614/g.52773  ORF Transcript_19614/g.52773 Transcript_19614/m.52773 type:complete len:336 (+) Transcript_19614:61-1068(+)
MWARCRRLLPAVPPAAAALSFVASGVGSGSGGGGPKGRLRGLASNCEQGNDDALSISVGCYNVLCSTYAVKWGEREGVGGNGATNWSLRWPVMCNIINRARWDVVCLQEVERTDVDEITSGLGDGYTTFYFKHQKRPPDGLMIAVRTKAFHMKTTPMELQHNGVAFGGVDLVHRASGRKVRVVTAHCRGRNAAQLEALADFAEDCREEPDVTVVTGDFNEDFSTSDRTGVRCPFPEGRAGTYTTLLREPELPMLSRPPHKQGEDQKSGKGKIDWIFVRGNGRSQSVIELFRDPASRLAILSSHAPCAATGHWPSDHGAEALSIRLLSSPKAKPQL